MNVAKAVKLVREAAIATAALSVGMEVDVVARGTLGVVP